MREDTVTEPLGRPEGTIEIADQAIRAIVREAVMSCYGIVDMAPRSLGSAIGKRLGLGGEHRGIAVHVADDTITIDLSVVVEYGTPIFTVAGNVMQTVKFHVERTLGMTVDRVNVTVDGLRVSQPQPAGRGA
ncbi:MAG: Asp23/Gls24 family envelope stress response protein [Chloroflexota bacterium]|nr:Asp23/Gls24 family envelope stress response protein [Chloroflexota bacterium]